MFREIASNHRAALARRSRGARSARFILGVFVATAALDACAAASEDDPTGLPEFAGPLPSPGAVPPGSSGSNGGSSDVPAGTPTVNDGSEPLSPGATPPVSNGTGGSGNIGGSSGGSGGSGAPGLGGSASTDPGGAAGASMGVAGSTSMPGLGGSAGQPPPAPPPPPAPVEPDIGCPAGATFCSGFESGTFPDDTRFHSVGPGLPNPFQFDSTEVFAGEQALVIPATNSGGFFYRALAVPVPGQNFWVRLYMHLSTPLGDNSHDSVFGGSSGGLDADVNGEALVELSEQFNEILLNTDDALFNPPTNSTLPANTWLCMEAHYDGGTGDVEIFADGQQLIDAQGYRALNYQSFRIGYMRYNDDRTVRFDDVIVAPNRIGCD